MRRFVLASMIKWLPYFFLFALEAYELRPIPLDAPGFEWIDESVNLQLEEIGPISKDLLDNTWAVCQERNSRSPPPSRYQRFQVVDSKIIGPPGQIRNLLSTLIGYYPLPDLDFIWYNQDIVKVKCDDPSKEAPIFVSAKMTGDKNRILFSDWYYDIKSQDNEGWNNTIDLINKEGANTPWNKKIEKLFWRGAPSDGHYNSYNWRKFPRGALVVHSQTRPDLVDAAFTGKGWHLNILEQIKRQARISELVPIVNHLKYKYQLIIDGVTATYPGTHWRLFCGSLSLKQDSPHQLWFSHMIRPWVHYVPVTRDLSNLINQIRWAKGHDAVAKAIALHAKEFAKTHLMPEHILLYCYRLLNGYSLKVLSP